MSSRPVLELSSHDDSGDAGVLADLFDSALEDQFAVNQRAAFRAETIAQILSFARARPHVYAHAEYLDAVEIAERAAIRDAAVRLQVSENTVRNLASVATTALERLPGLWQRARDGYAAFSQVESAAALLTVIGDDPDAAADFDRELTDAVVRLGATAFRAAARTAARRLSELPPEVRHRTAAQRRRVIVDPVDDGMAWLMAYLPLTEAVAAKRRLTATAKHLGKAAQDGRTRDQIRADLLSAWLRGVGTPTAVKTKVLVTVPVNLLAPKARATVRRQNLARVGRNLNDEALLDGRNPIEGDAAIAALLREGRFTRVITDPVSGAALDMDRRSRIATPAQRDWLTLAYATCAVDGCQHPAAESDIDHWIGFHGPRRGTTDIDNLHPLCGGDHVLKTWSKLRFVRGLDAGVRIQSPATRVHEPEDLRRRDDGHEYRPRDDQPDDPPDDPGEIRRTTSAPARLAPVEVPGTPPF